MTADLGDGTDTAAAVAVEEPIIRFGDVTRLQPEWHPGFDYHVCRLG